MSLNYKAALHIIGGLLTIFAIVFMLPALVSLIYKEFDNFIIFVFISICMTITGLILRKTTLNDKGVLGIREGLFVVSATWIIMTLIGAIPFMVSGDIPGFYDAIFETASGLSTTGATVLENIESLSKGMLFWRSLTHWLGGMGVLFLVIALIPILYQGKSNIALESTGPTMEKSSSKMADTAIQLYAIYFGLTIIQIILLCIGGMSLYDSAIHTFGSVGTGGFSNYGDSIAHFDSLYIELVIVLFMYLCGISFNLYFLALRRGPKMIIKNAEFRLYTYIIIVATLAIAFDLIIEGGYSHIGDTLRDSLFQVVSIITTTGYATEDFNQWPQFAKAVLLCLFFTGGCASSTAGGVKVYRILVLFRLVKRSIHIRLHPNAIINVNVQNKRINNDVVSNVTSFLLLYLSVLCIGMMLISFDNFGFTTNLTAAASCLGNVGPGFGLIGPMNTYNIFSGWSKIILSILMIAGRLELYTFLAVFTPHFWNPDRY